MELSRGPIPGAGYTWAKVVKEVADDPSSRLANSGNPRLWIRTMDELLMASLAIRRRFNSALSADSAIQDGVTLKENAFNYQL